MLDGYLLLGNEQTEILYKAGEEQYAKLAFDAVNRSLPCLCRYFDISSPFPKVTVILVPDRNEFDRLVRGLLQVEIEVPSHPARIAQPQRTDMVVISPSAYAAHTIYTYRPKDFRRLLAHELVHMIEEFVTPDIETTPRWWSEGLAVYLSGQWRYEDEFRKAAQDGITSKKIPSFEQIAEERTFAYDWGWTIVRYIEKVYGKKMIQRMVKECLYGDVFTVIGENGAILEKRWRDWLLANP